MTLKHFHELLFSPSKINLELKMNWDFYFNVKFATFFIMLNQLLRKIAEETADTPLDLATIILSTIQ